MPNVNPKLKELSEKAIQYQKEAIRCAAKDPNVSPEEFKKWGLNKEEVAHMTDKQLEDSFATGGGGGYLCLVYHQYCF